MTCKERNLKCLDGPRLRSGTNEIHITCARITADVLDFFRSKLVTNPDHPNYGSFDTTARDSMGTTKQFWICANAELSQHSHRVKVRQPLSIELVPQVELRNEYAVLIPPA